MVATSQFNNLSGIATPRPIWLQVWVMQQQPSIQGCSKLFLVTLCIKVDPHVQVGSWFGPQKGGQAKI